jgi:hypothetical protein
MWPGGYASSSSLLTYDTSGVVRKIWGQYETEEEKQPLRMADVRKVPRHLLSKLEIRKFIGINIAVLVIIFVARVADRPSLCKY